MTEQLTTWRGEFGTAYTDRNTADWRTLAPAFERMLGGLDIQRALEIGCNRGHNLVALAEGVGIPEVIGVEPNPYALSLARAASPLIGTIGGHAEDLPFTDGWFDVAFTCGVLIHIPPVSLDQALREIHRVSRRFVLAIEYYAERETCIQYRGHGELLWKRNFAEEYRRRFPGLRVVRDGYWSEADGFDRSHWWLMEKASPSQ
jgi:pseudaminic acid biosynthesis-associated methylase